MRRYLKAAAAAVGIRRVPQSIGRFAVPLEDVKVRGEDDFSKLFYGYRGGRVIHKWGHYLPIYSKLFAPYKRSSADNPLRFLEIGVSKGGSLELWRSYFGDSAKIFGIDIDPACAKFNDSRTQVRIGSQADRAFLESVVQEMGGVDVVLDDGSHVASHQRRSFEVLFPLLSMGGLYVVEDLHTSYWSNYEGGYRRNGAFIEVTKDMIDDMHAWYHERRSSQPELPIGAVHVFDSIVAFEKTEPRRPFHVHVGG